MWFLHTETFTHKSFYTEKSLHRGAFTRSNKLKLAAVVREKPLAGAFGNSLAPTKFLFHDFFKKHKEYISEAVPIQKLSSPQCDEMEGRKNLAEPMMSVSSKIRPGAPWPWHCRRRFSPLRRREGPPPQPPTHPVGPKTPVFYGVLCSSHFFSFFGACGLRWVNTGQHRPQDGPT